MYLGLDNLFVRYWRYFTTPYPKLLKLVNKNGVAFNIKKYQQINGLLKTSYLFTVRGNRGLQLVQIGSKLGLAFTRSIYLLSKSSDEAYSVLY